MVPEDRGPWQSNRRHTGTYDDEREGGEAVVYVCCVVCGACCVMCCCVVFLCPIHSRVCCLYFISNRLNNVIYSPISGFEFRQRQHIFPRLRGGVGGQIRGRVTQTYDRAGSRPRPCLVGAPSSHQRCHGSCGDVFGRGGACAGEKKRDEGGGIIFTLS